MTYEDYAHEEWMNSLYENFAKEVLSGDDALYTEVIERFASKRLQSYYLENPKLLEPAVWALGEARAMLTAHPAAALVLAVAAAEVGLRSGLLNPILHGLVHDDAMAVVIAELIPKQRNNHFKKLLFRILKDYGGVDLDTFKRQGINKRLWNEIEETQNVRNNLVHAAKAPIPADAEKAVQIAAVVIEKLFPALIRKLGLKADSSLVVSAKKK